MSLSDEFLTITDSRDTGDTSPVSLVLDTDESNAASIDALENNGVTILGEDTADLLQPKVDPFSSDLLDDDGIEIIRGANGDSDNIYS